MPLATVDDYIRSARRLLNDTDPDVSRFADADLKEALGLGIYEMRRVRPDLFLGQLGVPPEVGDATPGGTTLDIDIQYRGLLPWYMVGRMYLRDDENADGSKAAQYLTKFTSQLLALAA